MHFSGKELEAIAKVWASSSMPKNQKNIMYASCVACLAGVICAFWVNLLIGFAIAIVGALVLWFYVGGQTEKRRRAFLVDIQQEYKSEKELIEKRP